jgi:hypothetical protein
MTQPHCAARPTSTGEVRCAKCRILVDSEADLVCPCAPAPPLVPEPEQYVSALAPNYLR